MSKSNILIVDDHYEVRQMIKRALESDNILSNEVDNGIDAIKEISQNYYDLIILDINMEDMDGFDVILEIRKRDINTPIFILSGRSEDSDKILGYGIGADAYITKPFSPSLLCAMVKSKIKNHKKRQISVPTNNFIDLPPFRFDINSSVLYKNSKEIPLSVKESKLIRFFMENSNKVFTKEQLYSRIWNDCSISDNNIMVFIRKLRIKIEDDPNNPQYLKTVWGVGYVFTNSKE